MKQDNNIEELFKDGLENLEADVNPQVWSNIASGINSVSAAAGTVAGVKAVSSVYWIAGSIAIAVIATVSILLFNGVPNPNNTVVSNQPEQVSSENKLSNVVKSEKIPVSVEPEFSPSQFKNNPSAIKAIDFSKPTQPKIPSSSLPVEIESKNNQSQNTDIVKDEPASVESQPTGSSTLSSENKNQNETKEVEPVVNTNSTVAEVKKAELDMEAYFGELPNSFSPNGDNQNDLFMVHPNNVKSFSVTIFDRSGKMVHQWNNPNGFWDGLLKSGIQAPAGAYIYSIIGESSDGQALKKQGTITIFR